MNVTTKTNSSFFESVWKDDKTNSKINLNLWYAFSPNYRTLYRDDVCYTWTWLDSITVYNERPDPNKKWINRVSVFCNGFTYSRSLALVDCRFYRWNSQLGRCVCVFFPTFRNAEHCFLSFLFFGSNEITQTEHIWSFILFSTICFQFFSILAENFVQFFSAFSHLEFFKFCLTLLLLCFSISIRLNVWAHIAWLTSHTKIEKQIVYGMFFAIGKCLLCDCLVSRFVFFFLKCLHLGWQV